MFDCVLLISTALSSCIYSSFDLVCWGFGIRHLHSDQLNLARFLTDINPHNKHTNQ